MSCSLKRWFNDLPWMQQGVLLGAIRNCDGMPSIDTPHKILIRGIRSACIKSAKVVGSFNARRPILDDLYKAVNDLVEKNYIDALPFHFVAHLIFAAEVLAYKHPDEKFRKAWFYIYKTIVDSMHLNVEEPNQMEVRLQDDLAQTSRENHFDYECYFSGNYGNGACTVNESWRGEYVPR